MAGGVRHAPGRDTVAAKFQVPVEHREEGAVAVGVREQPRALELEAETSDKYNASTRLARLRRGGALRM